MIREKIVNKERHVTMSLSSVDSDDELFNNRESNSKDDDPIGKLLGNALLPSLFDHFAKRLGTTGCEG